MALTHFAAEFHRFTRHTLLPIGLLLGLGGSLAGADQRRDQLSLFSHALDERIGYLVNDTWGGMDTLKLVDRGELPIVMLMKRGAAALPLFGPKAPAAVLGKSIATRVVATYQDIPYQAKYLNDDIQTLAKSWRERAATEPHRISLFLVGVSRPDQAASREVLQAHIPIARFGDYGLFAVAGTSPEVAGILTDLVMRAQSPVIMEGVNVPGLALPAGSAQDLASLVASQPAGGPAGTASVPVREINTVGPQIKGYDPKQADRPPPVGPPPLKHIDWKAGGYGTGLCTWPDENVNLRREREAREAKAAAAKKPRLTMADYAKKAEQERAEFQVRKAKYAADHKEVLNWLLNDRNTKEADIRQRLQKRREYVDGQANRKDAVMHGKAFVEGGWMKIPLRNRTDISLKITIDFKAFDKNGERLGMSPHLSILLPLVEENLIIFAHEPGATMPDGYEITWVADPSNYQGNY